MTRARGSAVCIRTHVRALFLASLLLAPAGSPAASGPAQAKYYTGAGRMAASCFVAGDRAGVVFEFPPEAYPVQVERVGIAWGYPLGGVGASTEAAIHLYAGGLPDPGSPVRTLDAPQLRAGSITEFDVIPVVIQSGRLTVALEFLNANAGDQLAPSVVHDGNGSEPGRNVVYSPATGWREARQAGFAGDWVFHVTYRTVQGASAAANPPQKVFTMIPVGQTACDTLFVVSTGADTLVIASIQGCDLTPFAIDTTIASRIVPPGGSTPIPVCASHVGDVGASCTITVVSNAVNSPTVFEVSVVPFVLGTGVGNPPARGLEITGVIPNPFNPQTAVHFWLPNETSVTAQVWSVDGGRVQTLVRDEMFPAGDNAVRWDGRNSGGRRVGSGVYLVSIETTRERRVTRVVLLE